MMMSSLVLRVLLQLCTLQLMIAAMPLCKMQANLVQNSHNFLRDLGGPFPVHCLRYNVNITFPDFAFPAATARNPHCCRALWVVYESLHGMQLVLESAQPAEEGGVSWDEEKLNTFQNLMDRLLEEGSHLSAVRGPDVFSSYFSNVTAVVQQQDSPACGWMALRRDILWVLKTALGKHHSCFI